jgi:t-SNARE complex subunit (syntaxin)
MIGLKKKTAKDQFPKFRRQLILKICRRTETTFSQFSRQFNGEKVGAKTLLGLFARIETKLLGLSCCFAFN